MSKPNYQQILAFVKKRLELIKLLEDETSKPTNEQDTYRIKGVLAEFHFHEFKLNWQHNKRDAQLIILLSEETKKVLSKEVSLEDAFYQTVQRLSQQTPTIKTSDKLWAKFKDIAPEHAIGGLFAIALGITGITLAFIAAWPLIMLTVIGVTFGAIFWNNALTDSYKHEVALCKEELLTDFCKEIKGNNSKEIISLLGDDLKRAGASEPSPVLHSAPPLAPPQDPHVVQANNASSLCEKN